MLTYRTGAAGAPHSAQAMAEYLAKESHIAGMSDKLAAYYGHGLMSDEGITTSGIPMPGMDASIASVLGIDPTRPLSTMEMAHILAGQRTDGTDIPGKSLNTPRKVRISYVDFTLSAPKSFSIAIALAPTQAERAILDKCHTDAVDKTLAVIAETVGTISRGDTRKNFDRERGHVAVIKFEHMTARPVEKIPIIENGIDTTLLKAVGQGDMQRHTHCIMPAVVAGPDGRVGSIHQHAINQRIHEWGSLYQAYLATHLREHGVDVRLDDRPGLSMNERMARLSDVPQWAVDFFSKRTTDGRQAARDFAASRGLDYDTLSALDKANLLDASLDARKQSKEANGHADFDLWKADAKLANYQHRSVLRPGEGRGLGDRETRFPAAVVTSLALVEEQFEKRSVIEGSALRVAAAKGLIAAGIESARDINTITAAYRKGGVKQDGEVTKIHWAFDPAERFARVTTQLSVDQENEAISILRAASQDKSCALSSETLQRAVDRVSADGFDFTTGHGAKQREVMDRIAAAGRAVVAVGVAGSGKSTLLRPLIDAWHEDGRSVYGVTLGWRQTEGLKDAGIGKGRRKKGPKVEPIKDTLQAAGLADEKTYALTPFLRRMEGGALSLSKDSVLVIDEVALIGTRDMLRLARLQAAQGFQIVGIGDDLQAQPISAGASIDLMRRAFGADNVPELISTVRQHQERDRQTAMLFRDAKATEALQRKDEDGTLKIIGGGYEDAVRATVDFWFERRDANRGREGYSLGISVPTNADGLAIGEEVHRRRLALGEISPPICHVEAQDQNGARFHLDLSIGDRVRLFDRTFGKDANNHQGFVGNNGSVVEVAGADKNRLFVRKANGKVASVEWEDLRAGGDRIRLTRGDAVTIDARQSETLTEHITSMPSGSAAVTGFKAYVAESRQREASWIITSHGAEVAEIQQRRPIGDPRNDETDPAVVRASVIENMGRNLSRQPKKTLATEFMERAVNLKSGSTSAMQAAWFRQETRETHGKSKMNVLDRREAQAEASVIADVAKVADKAVVAAAQAPTPVTSVIPKERPRMSAAEVQAAFAQELERHGFRLRGAPVMDGKWHRAAVDGDKGAKKSGGYRGWATGGVINNFRGGEPITWHPDGAATEMSPEQRAAQRAADRADRIRSQAEQKANEEKVARDAEAAWNAARPAHPRHAYLVRKDIDSAGLRQGVAGQTVPMTDGKEMKIGGRLLVPLRDIDGKLWNLQIISPDGSKLFLPGRKRGLFFADGDLMASGPAILGEGVATMKTLRSTTSLTTVAAIDSGNLMLVATAIRARHKDKPLIFAADNDHHLPLREKPLPNVGLEKAKAASDQVGGVVVAPKFRPDDKGTDWNDVQVAQGRDGVRKAIEVAFEGQGVSPLLPPRQRQSPSPQPPTPAQRQAHTRASPQQRPELRQ